ncbi:MAG: hypothetical protein ACE5KI_00525 [Dehalococcoidia bacterium]
MDSQVNIKLEPLETFVLAQFTRYLVPDEQYPHVSRAFLMEFAVVLLHHTNDAGGLTTDAQAEEIPVSEDDILNLRELIPATATVGSTPVGLSIHRKLYEALLRYHPEQAAELQFCEEEEPSREVFAVELQRLKRAKRRWKK